MSNLSRRQTLGLGFGAGLSVTMLGSSREAHAAPAAPTFTLLLVNDIYKMGDDKGRGGFAKLAAVVKAERARGVPMLFCHAGDTFSPSLMSGFDQGAHIVELTNMIRPDIFVPGNHEFDFGKEVYFKHMAASRFPYFAANMRRADGSPIPGMKDSALFDLGPVKIGVVGLALAATANMSQSGDLKFLPELESLRIEAEALRRQGADMLVAVTHTDRDGDYAIVRSGLVDVLLTGHDHDLAIAYDGRTVMVESNEEGNFVTAIDVLATVTGDGSARKVAWSPAFRVHDSMTVDPDPEVLAVVRRYEGELSTELDVEIGATGTALDSRSTVVGTQEAAIGNLIADAIRASTGADVAIVNGGGIRANRNYAPGTVLTRRDILSEMPFGNTTVMIELTGADLKTALENGFSQVEHPAGRFPQISGMNVVVDRGNPPGWRVTAVTIAGQPLHEARRYRVATNNFMLRGGDGYSVFTPAKRLIGETDGKLMAGEVMAHIRKLGTVATKPEGRIVIR
jgi:5'-nucleotidase/UDP-sugar diphosphatase